MTYLLLFWEFFKVGLFTFGGGLAMLPLIEDAVLRYAWLTEEQFYSFVGVCESTPGPIAVNMATYVGASQGGFPGSLCATLGVVLPSFLVILLVATVLKSLTENRFFKAFLRGVNPVVVALILSTGVILLFKTVGYSAPFSFSLRAAEPIILLLLLLFDLLFRRLRGKRLSAVWLILTSAALGILVCSLVGGVSI